MDKRFLTPSLDRLTPVVAGLPDPFTLKDIMMASGTAENPARAALMSMKTRGWVEDTGKRVGAHGGHILWTRTRWYGLDRVRAQEAEQRAGMEQLGQCLSGWRVSHV